MLEFAPICIYLVISLLVSLIFVGLSFLFSYKNGISLIYRRVSTRTPKNPNSALRKIAKVRLSNRHEIYSDISTFLYFLIKRGIRSSCLFFIRSFLWGSALTWAAPLFILDFCYDWIDLLMYSMEPLYFGGGGSDPGPSRRPFDLNQPPAESEPPEPADPGPSRRPFDLNQPPAPELAPEQQPRPFRGRAALKEELRKAVKRLRVFQGNLNYWEILLEQARQKERESEERKRIHLHRMQELANELWNGRGSRQ